MKTGIAPRLPHEWLLVIPTIAPPHLFLAGASHLPCPVKSLPDSPLSNLTIFLKDKSNPLSRGADADQPSGLGEMPLHIMIPLRRQLHSYSHGAATIFR